MQSADTNTESQLPHEHVPPIPRIGIWPFRRVDWEAVEAFERHREAMRKHERWMLQQWQRLDVSLSSMSNEDALRCFFELCRGRAWTTEQADEISSLAQMSAVKR